MYPTGTGILHKALPASGTSARFIPPQAESILEQVQWHYHVPTHRMRAGSGNFKVLMRMSDPFKDA
ncbi:MAG: hypothetical protein II730_04560 [Bacteroidales bacterium]|nr:hypothetical protein [Bacteroidales bacterium]